MREAARVLDDEMVVDYEGSKDSRYPNKLAERIQRLLKEPALFELSRKNPLIAETNFEYTVLAERIVRIIEMATKTV